jgi:hypothetical protein
MIAQLIFTGSLYQNRRKHPFFLWIEAVAQAFQVPWVFCAIGLKEESLTPVKAKKLLEECRS